MIDDSTLQTEAAIRTVAPRRSFPARFGLRSLFVFAFLFCLLFAWLGRNLYRLRQEDAAIETLKQAGAIIMVTDGDQLLRHAASPALAIGSMQATAPEPDWYGRLLGWTDRPRIHQVTLDSYGVDGEKLQSALAALGVFPEIESVSLRDEGFDDASLAALKRLPNLDSIHLDGARVTGTGLATLGPPLRITKISIYGQRTAPDLLVGLGSLPELRAVTLHEVQVSRSDIETIAGLPHLEDLHLRHCEERETDAFEPLSNAAILRSLEIDDSSAIPFELSFRDDDVSAIAALPSLETLQLFGIADAGLTRLGELPKLKEIELRHPVSEPGARAFSASHPECLVFYFDAGWMDSAFKAGVEVDPVTARTMDR